MPGAKRKKLGKQGAFPKFDDGDVVISLGAAHQCDLMLYREDLSRMCEYFNLYDEVGWPDKFILHPSADASKCQVVPVS